MRSDMKKPIPNSKIFGNRLKILREAKGLTQKDLGDAAGGMKDSAIARLEAGHRSPTWDTVLALASALGVTPDAFTDKDDDEPPAKKKPPKKGEK